MLSQTRNYFRHLIENKTRHSSTLQPNRLTFPLMMFLVGGTSGTSTETAARMYLSGCNGNK